MLVSSQPVGDGVWVCRRGAGELEPSENATPQPVHFAYLYIIWERTTCVLWRDKPSDGGADMHDSVPGDVRGVVVLKSCATQP